jgi:hypothetical protein
MMITAIASDSPVAGPAQTDFRSRLAQGERSLLPTSTPPATGSAGPGEDGQFATEQRETAVPPPVPSAERGAVFAAAVISGALSPTPQSVEEVIKRIGSSTIPVESEARLKDLLA